MTAVWGEYNNRSYVQPLDMNVVESSYLGKDQLPSYQAIGLGAANKAGICLNRHDNSGLCWSNFQGENTKFLSRIDFDSVATARAVNPEVFGQPNTAGTQLGSQMPFRNSGNLSSCSFGFYLSSQCNDLSNAMQTCSN